MSFLGVSGKVVLGEIGFWIGGAQESRLLSLMQVGPIQLVEGLS